MEAGVDFGDDRARPPARLALKNDETPGRELAMVGNAGADLQQRLNLAGIGTRAAQRRGRRRAPGFQQFDRGVHSSFIAGSRSPA